MLKIGPILREVLNETIERNKLIKAIEDKRLMTIYYDSPHDGDKEGYTKGWRRIEPFCYGINNSNNACLRAWQVHGVSNSYPPGKDNDSLTEIPGWRMFRIDGIKSINEAGNDRFLSPRPKYNPNDKDMKIIYKAAKFGDDSQPTVDTKSPANVPPPTSSFNTFGCNTQSQISTGNTQQPQLNTGDTQQVISTGDTNNKGLNTNIGNTVPSVSKTGSEPIQSSKPDWFTKFGDKFKHFVNYGKKDSDKI